MPIEMINYRADGLDMVGRLVLPDRADGARPAVLVFPHATGPGEHSLGKAERLAKELGYIALECDLYGNGRELADLNEAVGLLAPMRERVESVRVRALGPLEALVGRPEVDPSRVAAIGFCFGGTMSFELALAGADIKAAIGFHSGLKVTSPGDAGNIKCKILALIGADDPYIPPEAREEFVKVLALAGVDYTLTVYGGVVHSFTFRGADRLGRPEFSRYDARADRRSWAQMADLLAEAFA